jgi:hypothetical protein
MAKKKTVSQRRASRIDTSGEAIASLAEEAAKFGDKAMVKTCGKALSGNKAARRECYRVMMAARAMS